MKISIFENTGEKFCKEVYLHGINEEVKEIFIELKHPTKIAKQLGVKYTKLKEWAIRKKPISLFDLKKLLNLCPEEFKKTVTKKIESKETRLSCKYSPHKIKISDDISEDLAYIIGIILGDGSVACDNSNSEGNWTIIVFFDNKEHRAIYEKLVENEFKIKSISGQRKENCFESGFASKIIHTFFVKELGMHNGRKAHKICFPEKILNGDLTNKAALIQGLFDSDGTITNGYIRYSTVSKIMAEQVQKILFEIDICTSINVWIKDPKYYPLYTVSVKTTKCKKLFAQKIGFRHPIKKLLLKRFSDSPLV
ncbi:MAG: LAGLIDADG family homing endonuclease [archaeon]